MFGEPCCPVCTTKCGSDRLSKLMDHGRHHHDARSRADDDADLGGQIRRIQYLDVLHGQAAGA